jgi:hypothetical protein
MPEVHPGSHKYSGSESIPFELGSTAALRGDAVAIGASGTAVRTTGSNPFLGVLQSATQADADAGNLGPGVDPDVPVASGETATVAMQGVVRAKVSGTFDSDGSGTNDPVSAGEKIVAGASGALENVSDGASPPAGVVADVGEPKALTDEDAAGMALVFLG